MTPEYALTQLLKLSSLSLDQIVKYTGWKYGKAKNTIESLKQAGVIQWHHKPSRYAVRMLHDTPDGAAVQRLPIALSSMRDSGHQRTAKDAIGAGGKINPIESMAGRLCGIWSQRSRIETAGEVVSAGTQEAGVTA